MSSDLSAAKKLLRDGDFTLAAVCGTSIVTSRERGVKPLLALLDSGVMPRGFSAADKVVGKAAAFLYVLLGAGEVYTDVISESALEVLKNGGISVGYGTLVPAIRNRDNTGFCPMETAVSETSDPETALLLIRKKLEAMHNNS